MNTINQFEINKESGLELKVQAASNQIAQVLEDLLDAYVFWTEVDVNGVLRFGGSKDGLSYEGTIHGAKVNAVFDDGTNVELTTDVNLQESIAVVHNRNESYRLADG